LSIIRVRIVSMARDANRWVRIVRVVLVSIGRVSLVKYRVYLEFVQLVWPEFQFS